MQAVTMKGSAMKCSRNGVVWATLIFLCSLIDGPVLAAHYSSYEYEIEISKSHRTLLLKRGSKIEKRYPVSLGSGGRGDKLRVGDHRTPTGTYRIVKVKSPSRFHTFFQLSYPNVKDAFYGLRGNIISTRDFERIAFAQRYHLIPPQDTRLGGAIGIHGIGYITPQKVKIHWGSDWTRGCIALTNEQIEDLSRFIGVGTKVVINE